MGSSRGGVCRVLGCVGILSPGIRTVGVESAVMAHLQYDTCFSLIAARVVDFTASAVSDFFVGMMWNEEVVSLAVVSSYCRNEVVVEASSYSSTCANLSHVTGAIVGM